MEKGFWEFGEDSEREIRLEYFVRSCYPSIYFHLALCAFNKGFVKVPSQ